MFLLKSDLLKTEQKLIFIMTSLYFLVLSYDVASGSETTPCIKIDKPLAVYRFSGNVMK